MVIWIPSAPAVTEESELKAAFIYNFIKFLEWPPEAFEGPESPIVICTLGESPLAKAVQGLQGKELKQRRLTVKSIETPLAAHECHVLVTSGVQDREALLLKASWSEMPFLLTVSDQRGFAERNGMIEMISLENRIRFDVNLSLIGRSSLKISSQLLNLAHKIIK
jgi:hypothetical protein